MPKSKNKEAKENAVSVADAIYNHFIQMAQWSGNAIKVNRETDRRMIITVDDNSCVVSVIVKESFN